MFVNVALEADAPCEAPTNYAVRAVGPSHAPSVSGTRFDLLRTELAISYLLMNIQTEETTKTCWTLSSLHCIMLYACTNSVKNICG